MNFTLVKCTMARSTQLGLSHWSLQQNYVTMITSNVGTIVQVRLGWSAPGGDWSQGRAAAYNLTCTGTKAEAEAEAEAEVEVGCEETPVPTHYGETQTCSLALAGTMKARGELRCSLQAVDSTGNW